MSEECIETAKALPSKKRTYKVTNKMINKEDLKDYLDNHDELLCHCQNGRYLSKAIDEYFDALK
jgi:hypothetical protein